MLGLLESPASLATMTVTICFVTYHYFFRASSIKHVFRGGDAEGVQRLSIYGQRLAGFICLGFTPVIISQFMDLTCVAMGLGPAKMTISAILVGGIVIVVLPIVYLQSRLPKALEEYPEVRAIGWSSRDHLVNGLTWCVYLLSYEFFFRGFLLFTLNSEFGFWPAVTLSTGAYVFAHLDKPASETLGSIPIGLLFGYVALESGGIWGPVVAHCVIAVANDYFCHKRRARSLGIAHT